MSLNHDEASLIAAIHSFICCLTGFYFQTACLDEPDSEIIEASIDFILTLRGHSAAAAEHFLRPLSEELVPPCSDEAFNRLHITSYGLCLLSSLFNQLRLKQVILAFHNVD